MSKFTDRLRDDASEMANGLHRSNVKSAAVVIDDLAASLRETLAVAKMSEYGPYIWRANSALRRLEELSK